MIPCTSDTVVSQAPQKVLTVRVYSGATDRCAWRIANSANINGLEFSGGTGIQFLRSTALRAAAPGVGTLESGRLTRMSHPAGGRFFLQFQPMRPILVCKIPRLRVMRRSCRRKRPRGWVWVGALVTLLTKPFQNRGKCAGFLVFEGKSNASVRV